MIAVYSVIGYRNQRVLEKKWVNFKCYSKYVFFAVYADGGICLDILQNRWSPTYDVSSILTSIQVSFLNIRLRVSYNIYLGRVFHPDI